VSFSKDGDDEAIDLFKTSGVNRALILSAGAVFNISFAFLLFVFVYAFGKNLSVTGALLLSVKTVWSVFVGTVGFIVNIFSGHGSMEGLAGPVGIAAIAGKAAAKGILNLVYFTGMLSLSVGIMNLIPFPALDGGQLFMLLIEAIKRKPLSLRTYQVVNLVGMGLFFILTVLVTYKDIAGMFA
jgi:regulator of sigma E protease